jgi:hypothetical protein
MRALLLMLLAGCAPTASALTCPNRGGAKWTETTSAHFVLRTDLPSAETRSATEELERAYVTFDQLLRADLPEAPPLPVEKLSVVFFRNRLDHAALFPAYVDRGFYRDASNEGSMIVVTGELDDWARRSLRHEVTHRLVAHYLPTASAWLNEGIARLFEGATFADRRVLLGKWSDTFNVHGYQPDVRELFASDQREFHEKPSYYTEAYALVHLLQSERRGYRPRFLAYLQRVSSGIRDDLAWRMSFGDLDLDALERAQNAHRIYGLRIERRVTPIALPQVTATSRQMSDADVHLMWVELRNWSRPEIFEKAKRDLAEAERQEPTSVRVHYWRARLLGRSDPRLQVTEYERVLAIEPDNSRVLAVLYQLTKRREFLERLKPLARTPGALWLIAAEVPLDEGVEKMKQAAALAPGGAMYWWVLSSFQMLNGQLVEAAQSAQRAWWLSPDASRVLDGLRSLLIEIRSRGLPPPPPPFGDLRPPPGRSRHGVTLRGSVVEAVTEKPVTGAWVHALSEDEFDMVRLDASGRFELRVPPGQVHVLILPDDDRLIADGWSRKVRPSAAALELGVFHIVDGRLPLLPVAYDGIDAQSFDGRVLVSNVEADSPAGRAGIRAGDEILQINGRDVTGRGSQSINYWLLGEVGATVSVATRRGTLAPQTYEFQLAPMRRR